MFKNEEDKISTHLIIALQAFHGIQCKYYNNDKDKEKLALNLYFFTDYCEYHKLLDYDTRLKNILNNFIKQENLIQWLNERSIKE